jgi:SAM-dependent methyltransferase
MRKPGRGTRQSMSTMVKQSPYAGAIPFSEYSVVYDLIYQDKDYLGEAQFVARLLNRFLDKPTEKTEVLDIACGTGRHIQELASMGFLVMGSDLSANMVKVARDRTKSLGLSIDFHNESFQSCDRIGQQYDAVIAMFSAIDYLTNYSDIARSLKNIRGLLRTGGAFIFDFWNGNAVLKSHSPLRFKRVQKDDEVVIRISNTTIDSISQIATINFDFMVLKAGNVVREFSEVHSIRYFFPQEMKDMLAANGFEVVHRCPFLREDSEIEPDEWNLTYVARPFNTHLMKY